MKLEAFDSSYFQGKNFSGGDVFQNMFVYQPIFNTLESKKDKGTGYVVGQKSKGLSEFKHLQLHGAFLPNIKYFGQKIEIQFNSTTLVLE